MTTISEKRRLKAEIRAETKKRKLQKTDGLGPLEKKKIRAALRQVWHRCHARRTVVVRCTRDDGFSYCEKCGGITPALKIDHIEAVGEVGPKFIERLFVPSSGLQGLCKKCHDSKTKAERAVKKKIKKSHDWGF